MSAALVRSFVAAVPNLPVYVNIASVF